MCYEVGATVVSVMNAITSLLVDLVPNQSSSVTACVCHCLFGFNDVLIFPSWQNNVVRCLMGAGMVTIINPIITAMGNGWAYVLLGGFCILVSPLIWIEVRWGPIWRERRLRAQEQSATPPSP